MAAQAGDIDCTEPRVCAEASLVYLLVQCADVFARREQVPQAQHYVVVSAPKNPHRETTPSELDIQALLDELAATQDASLVWNRLQRL